MKKLTEFYVWYFSEFGIAIREVKAVDFRDAYNRCPAKTQRSFYEIENRDTDESISKEDLFDFNF